MRVADSMRQRRNRQRAARSKRLTLEALEDRHLLAAVVTNITPGAGMFANAVNTLLDTLPNQIRDNIPDAAIQLLDAVQAGTIYQAFPGEVNDFDLLGDLANVLLLLRESPDVSLLRAAVPPAVPPITRDIIDLLLVDIPLNIAVGGSFVVEGDGETGIEIDGDQIKAAIKQAFDLTDARAIIPNASAILDLLPDLRNVVDVLTKVLDFDLSTILDTIDIEPLITFGPVKVAGATILPRIEIPPEFNLGEFVRDTGIPTSLRDILELLPGPAREIVDQVISFVDLFKNEFIPDDVFISTLDGPDKIRFERLTGIPVTVYAGTGEDTIEVGGGDPILIELLDSIQFVGELLSPFYEGSAAKIQLYGEDGRDTFVLSPRFSNGDFNVDGGEGNDTIRIDGSDSNDIFELIADGMGKLREYRYYAPDPNGGLSANEIQVVTMPSDIQGGQFRLSFQNPAGLSDTTSPIAFDATAAAVQQVLESLASIGPGNVNVLGAPGGPWTIQFSGALATANQRPLTADGRDLQQTGAAIDVTVKDDGDAEAGVNDIQEIVLPPDSTGGTFTLSFEGSVTSPISAFASRSQVLAALEALPNLEPGDVAVSGPLHGPYLVEFTGDRAVAPQQLIVADSSQLTGGVNVQVTTTVDPAPRVVRIAMPSPSPSNGSIGGTFRLLYDNGVISDTTAPIAADASAAAVQAALQSLASVGANNAVVTLVPTAPGQPRAWDVELFGRAASDGQPLFVPNFSGLTGGIDIVVNESSATAINEVQRIPSPFDAGARAGTFRLTLDNGTIFRTTGDLPYDATVIEIQAALEQLASVGGATNVRVSGTTRGPWDATFLGDLSGADLPSITVDPQNLTGPADPAAINEAVMGAPGVNEQQTLALDPLTIAGTFRLEFAGQTTAPIAFNATASQVQGVLAALPTIGIGNVVVSGPSGGPWTVQFVGALGQTDVPSLSADVSQLIARVELPPVLELTKGVAGTNERQQVTFSQPPAAGTFTLTVENETTQPIAFNATAEDLSAALATLVNLSPNDFRVTGTPGSWTVEFIGRRAGLQSPSPGTIVGHAQNLVGAGVISVAETNPGTDEVQRILFDPIVPANGGTFRARFDGSEYTPPLAFNITTADLQQALENLSTIGAGNVSVSGTPGDWSVTFIGDLASDDVDFIRFDRSQLRRDEPIVVSVDRPAGHIDANQQIRLPFGVNGGTFALAFKSVLVEPVQEGGGGANERQSVRLTPGANGGTFTLSFKNATTQPIAFNANPSQVATALAALPTVGGAGNVSVTGSAGNWSVEFRGALADADQPLFRGDASNLIGSFTTAPIPHNATAAQVQAALQATLSFGGPGANNVLVDGDPGAWDVTFVGDLGGIRLQAITADGSQLAMSRGPNPTVNTDVQGGNGDPQLIARTIFNTLRDVEQLVINGNGGDDRLIVRGAAGFPLGIYFDGGDGIDYLELESQSAAPVFVSPIFPGDDQATLTLDGQNVEFAGVEGGLELDAAGRAAQVSIAGTDGGNEIRFIGLSAGRASVPRDGQVALILDRFGASSDVTLTGEQGGDEISLALNGITEFAHFTINGNGPTGADTLRFEGTPGNDVFGFRYSAASTEEGQATIGAVLPATIDFLGIAEVSFVGLEGADEITVGEPAAGSSDYVLVFPQPGNDSSFKWTTQQGGAGTAIAYPQIPLLGIESRIFDTGIGADTLALLSDDVPGVNSEATVVGGNGTTSLLYFDQPTQFIHDVAEIDAVVLEMGSVEDLIDVTPGVGLDVYVNTGVGNDYLTYRGEGGDVTVDVAAAAISQAGFGDVIYSGVDHVALVDGASLTISATNDDDEITYTPLSASGGRVRLVHAVTDFTFSEFASMLLVGNESAADRVTVDGTNGRDQIAANGGTRSISVRNSAGTLLMPVDLDASIELVVLNGRDGDDLFLVVPEPGQTSPALHFFVDGQSPNGFDRLVVQDEGLGNVVRHHQSLDQQSGAIVVGMLPPIGYADIERVDILPLDAVSGGTGADGAGRIVVFHSDELEQNDSRLNATEFGDLEQTSHKPNIDPGGESDPFGIGLNLPGDEDWYRFVATTTDTLRFGLVFDAIGTLTNGNPGLPGDGLLRIEAYDVVGNPIPKIPGEGAATHTIGVETGKTYFLRVRGATVEAINVYDFTIEDLDNIGPQVTDVCITDNPATPGDECDYNLFAPKPETDGPTPLVDRLTISIRDLVERFPGFLYPALNEAIALSPGHYRVVGDANGIIPIRSVTVVNDPVIVGQPATASIVLEFYAPLPDDRFTLFVSDSLRDPTGVNLDGESNAAEPQDPPSFPSGDGVPGGEFVARFTVDSRPEIGVWSAGSVYVDTNGNNTWDPTNTDYTNRDITYVLGFTSDNLFAGDFSAITSGQAGPVVVADGFDKLGGYGFAGGSFRWLIDITNDGVPDIVHTEPAAINGVPVSGNFDGNLTNGDEVALFTGTKWHFDTNHDYRVDAQLTTSMRGTPVVGDFNGDGFDDLATWSNDVFYIDLYNAVLSGAVKWDGVADVSFGFGFPGTLEKPVAADMNRDGFEDIGLWVPNRSGATPDTEGEWYFLISVDPNTDRHVSIISRIVTDPTTQQPVIKYTPIPFGHDVLAQFGDEFALPVVGNFDPPVAPSPVEPVMVTDIAVNGSGWVNRAPASSSAGGLDGVSLGAGTSAEHLAIAAIDQLVVRYASDAEVRLGDLTIVSAAGVPYAIDAFAYNPATRVATWTLDRPLDADRVQFSLRNAGVSVWSKSLSVLPGDLNANGTVDLADIAAAVSVIFGGDSTAAATADVNGDGSRNLRDMIDLRNRLGTSLPALSGAAAGALTAHAGTLLAGGSRTIVNTLARRPTTRRLAVDTAIASLTSSDDSERFDARSHRRSIATRYLARR